MTDTDLDQAYSAVCEALSQVGETRTPLFLSMLCLSLMSRFERADDVLPLIANALAQSEKEPTDEP